MANRLVKTAYGGSGGSGGGSGGSGGGGGGAAAGGGGGGSAATPGSQCQFDVAVVVGNLHPMFLTFMPGEPLTARLAAFRTERYGMYGGIYTVLPGMWRIKGATCVGGEINLVYERVSGGVHHG